MNCGQEGVRIWDGTFLSFFLFNFAFPIQEQFVERTFADVVNFFPFVYISRQMSLQLCGGLCEGKVGPYSEKECFVYILRGEYVKSMVFKFIWALF